MAEEGEKDSKTPGDGFWQVWRHGGASNHRWRRVIRGQQNRLTQRLARLMYETEACSLRQGEVRLVHPDGRIIARTSAPRLRTRW